MPTLGEGTHDNFPLSKNIDPRIESANKQTTKFGIREDSSVKRNMTVYSNFGFQNEFGDEILLEPPYWESILEHESTWMEQDYQHEKFITVTKSVPRNSGGNSGVQRKLNWFTAATTPLSDNGNSHYPQTFGGSSKGYEVNLFGTYMIVNDMSTILSSIDVLKEATSKFAHQIMITKDTIARNIAYAESDKWFAHKDDIIDINGTQYPTSILKWAHLSAMAAYMRDYTIESLDAALLNDPYNKGDIAAEQDYLNSRIKSKSPRMGFAKYKKSYPVLLAASAKESLIDDERYRDHKILAKEFTPYNSNPFEPQVELEFSDVVVFTDINPIMLERKLTDQTDDIIETEVAIMHSQGSFGRVELAGETSVRFISKAPGSSGTADPLDRISTMGWKAWIGYVLWQDGGIQTIEYLKYDTGVIARLEESEADPAQDLPYDHAAYASKTWLAGDTHRQFGLESNTYSAGTDSGTDAIDLALTWTSEADAVIYNDRHSGNGDYVGDGIAIVTNIKTPIASGGTEDLVTTSNEVETLGGFQTETDNEAETNAQGDNDPLAQIEAQAKADQTKADKEAKKLAGKEAKTEFK